MKFNKSVTLKPIVLIEMLMIVVLAGSGAALAFTHSQTVTDDDSVLGGIQYELTMSNSGVTVTDYQFTYDAGLEYVTAVTGNLAGADGDKVHVLADVGNADFSTHGWARTASVITIASSVGAFTCTLDSSVALDDITNVNIVVEECVNA